MLIANDIFIIMQAEGSEKEKEKEKSASKRAAAIEDDKYISEPEDGIADKTRRRSTDVQIGESSPPPSQSSSIGITSVSSDIDGPQLCPKALVSRGYSIGEEIGGGAFSKVYKSANVNHQEKEMAVKIIQLNKVPERWKEKCLRKEMKIVRRLQHPNIIRVWDIIKTRTRVYIFMEYASKNSIGQLVRESGPILEDTSRQWTSQTASALSYMHSVGIAHRDLKTENILLDHEDNAKVSDFGFACFTYDLVTQKPTTSPTLCGTAAYIAPEVLTPPYDAKKADCWSLGICTYEMLTACRPFSENIGLKRMYQRQMARKYGYPPTPEVSAQAKDLISKLLDPNPETRLTAKSVFQHEWLTMAYRMV